MHFYAIIIIMFYLDNNNVLSCYLMSIIHNNLYELSRKYNIWRYNIVFDVIMYLTCLTVYN